MAGNVTKKYTVELNLDVKTADAQVKKLATNINNMWADMGSAGNKFAVLKDLADYLDQIDKKIAGLKGKDLDLFNKIFGADGAKINAALKDAVDPILKTPGLIADAMNEVQTKLTAIQDNPKAKGTAASLREIGGAINQMYKLIGQAPPINIEEQLTGGGKVGEKLAMLTKHFEAFEVKWKDVLATVNTDGGEFSSFSGMAEGVRRSAQDIEDEIDNLEQQINRLGSMQKDIQKILGDIKQYDTDGSIFSPDTKFTIQDVTDAIKEFGQAKKEFENFKGDKSSIEYFEVLSKYMQQSAKVGSMYSMLTDVDNLNNKLYKKMKTIPLKNGKGTYADVLRKVGDSADDALSSDLSASLSQYAGSIDNQIDKISARMMTLENQLERVDTATSEVFSGGTDNKLAEAAGVAQKQVEELTEAVADLRAENEKLQQDLADTKNELSASDTALSEVIGEKDVLKRGQEKEAQKVVDDWNKAVAEIRDNGIESSDSANYYEGQLDAIKAHIEELHELGRVSDEVMSQVQNDYKEAMDGYIGFARGNANTYNDLMSLRDRADITNDKSELAEIVTKRKALIDMAEEEGWFSEDVLETQRAITLEIAKRAGIKEDDYDDWIKENGALEQKLELLKEIAYEYGNTITQKQRNRLSELDDKEMSDTGLTAKEEDKQAELFDIIQTADRAIEDLGNIYEKIVLTLDNGKKIEINPDDAGLRALAKFDDEGHGESYNGQEITDVLFVRKQEQAVVEQTNDALREQAQIQQKINAEAAQAKLKELDEVGKDIDSLYYGNEMTDIRIGKYTEQLNTAEEAIKSLGEQELLTAQQIEHANEVIANSRELLKLATRDNELAREEAEGKYDYTYAAELAEEESKNETLRAENNDLRQQLAKQHEDVTQEDSSVQEATKAEELLQKIRDVKQAVEEKTAAFREEADTVDGVVGQEVLALNRLKEAITDIELALDTAFAADRKLNLPEVKTGGVTTAENPHYVTDPQGKPVTMYRGIHGAYGGLVSNRYHGGTFSTDNLELAKEYAGELGKVEKVLLSMKKPLEIEGNGALWNQIEYIGTSSDKTSRRLHELQSELSAVNELIKEYEQIQPTDKENDLIRKGLITETEAQRKLRGLASEKAKLESEKKAIFADSSNPYGIKNTNQIVEIAKAEGFDGVIFKNIIDSATGAVNDMSNVMVTFEQNQIHYVETIGATLDNALNLLKQRLGPFADYINSTAKEISDAVATASVLERKLSVGEITQDEYDKLSADNLVLKDLTALSQRLGTTPDFIKKELLSGDSFSLETLEGVINSFFVNMRERLQNIATTFGVDDIPLNDILNPSKLHEASKQQTRQDKINANSTPNLLQSIDQILGQILAVLQGFTGIESDNKNSIKVKEPVPEVSVGGSDAYELLANKLPDGIATESTLGAIRGSVEQIASLLKIGDDANVNAKDTEDLSNVAVATDVVADNLKGIVYHAGDLSNIANTLKTLPLGNFKPTEMDATFNGFTGLYTTEDFEHLSGNEWEGAPISTIDLSQYKMFDAKSDELATKVKDFFNSLNKAIYGYIEAWDYDAGDIVSLVNDKTVEELYREFQQVFQDVKMDFKTFQDFIDRSKAVVKGHTFNDIEIPDLDQAVSKFGTGTTLQGVSQEVFNADTFQTQLLKMLGFEGIDLRGTKYNSAYTGGTVLFDIKPESVKSVNEKWTDVARRNYPENDFWYDSDALSREEKRRQLAFETARAYSQQAQIEQQITAEKKQQASIDNIDSTEVANAQYEATEMQQLAAQVRDVEAAVQAKTNAFTQEGAVVNQIVQQEIAALQILINKLAEAKAAIEAKAAAFVADSAAVNDAVAKEAAAIGTETVTDNVSDVQKEAQAHKDNVNAIREETVAQQNLNEQQKQDDSTPKQKKSSKKKKTPEQMADERLQTGALNKYKKQLAEIDRSLDFASLDVGLTPQQQEIADLYNNATQQIEQYLDAVKNGEQVEVNSVQNVIAALRKKADAYTDQKSVTEEQVKNRKDTLGDLSTSLRDDFRKLDFKDDTKDLTDEQQKIANNYKELQKILKDYGRNAAKISQDDVTNIQQRVVALQDEINKYREMYNIVDGRGGVKNAYGKTAAVNAQAKYNSIESGAQKYIDAGSTIVAGGLKEYKAALTELMTLQRSFKSGQVLTSEQETQFTELKNKCNDYYKSLKKVIDASDDLRTNGSKPMSIMDDVSLETFDDRANALKAYVQEIYPTGAAIEGLNSDATKLFFTLKKGDGTITNMTAALNRAGTEIRSVAGDTEKVTTKFSRFFDSLKGKFGELLTYAAARFGIDEIFQVLRQGIEDVRAIDSALTELKKVTNGTSAEYDAFLETMASTGSRIGATVSDLTTMAAEWAKLGYTMQESAMLAESTAVLLNVSEFTDATAASEALISTMQAFGYGAEESMHVVDILNEVGNNYAITSDGIAVALQDSASALMEGGNSLEEAVALVAAANRVVQDPNSVGAALRTISLRLRGKKFVPYCTVMYKLCAFKHSKDNYIG